MSFIFFILVSQINIDIGRFKAADDYALCELYISLPYSDLLYKKEGNILKADFTVRLTIKSPESQNDIQLKKVVNKGESSLFEVVREFNRISYINSYEEAESRGLHMLDQIELFLKPGRYEMKLDVISDSVSKSIEKMLEIEPPQSQLYLSDIELAISIEPSDSGKFVKNGLKIIPHPQAVFGEKYPTVYAYTEIYNLEPDNKYEVNYNIFNEAGDTLYTLPPKILSTISRDITEVGSVDISAFKEGTYILKVKVTQDNQSAVKEKKFWVIKETKEEIEFTAEELEYYHLIKYIATQNEIKFYNSLSNEAKHLYLVNFWKRAGRPLLHTLIKRVKYADQNFSSMGELGRDSDRGRIWIKYGKPDEIERFSFDRTYHACEKWRYFGRGGIVFIFVDKSDDDRYELMYSNIPEERTAPDYLKWVNPEALP